jgi:hypothetical protein
LSAEFFESDDDALESETGAFDSAARAFGPVVPRLRVISKPGEPPNGTPDEIGGGGWDRFDETLEARLDGTHGRAIAPFSVGGAGRRFHLHDDDLPGDAGIDDRRNGSSGRKTLSSPRPTLGIKRRTPKQIKDDMPPTPRGCEWRRSDEGWNLWRYWSEPDERGQGKIKKTRYAGHLSHDAWQIMKEFDHETFLSIIGQRLRRHSRG